MGSFTEVFNVNYCDISNGYFDRILLCEYFVGDVIVNDGTYMKQVKPRTHTLLQSYILK